MIRRVLSFVLALLLILNPASSFGSACFPTPSRVFPGVRSLQDFLQNQALGERSYLGTEHVMAPIAPNAIKMRGEIGYEREKHDRAPVMLRIAEAFGLGEVHSLRWIPGGAGRMSRPIPVISTPQGTFLIKPLKLSRAHNPRFVVDYARYLQAQGIPLVLASKSGSTRAGVDDFIAQDAESGGPEAYIVERWTSGREISRKDAEPATLAALGRFLGHVHAVSRHFQSSEDPGQGEYSFRRAVKTFMAPDAAWLSIAGSHLGDDEQVLIRQVQKEARGFWTPGRFQNLPAPQPILSDPNFSNMRFNEPGDNVISFFDWDHAGFGYRWEEFYASLIQAGRPGEANHVGRLREDLLTLLKGYRMTVDPGLEDDEIRLLPQFFATQMVIHIAFLSRRLTGDGARDVKIIFRIHEAIGHLRAIRAALPAGSITLEDVAPQPLTDGKRLQWPAPVVMAHEVGSLEAVRKAVASGVRMLELDVQMTRDGKLIVWSGHKIKTTEGEKFSYELSKSELDAVLGHPVMDVEDLFRAIGGRGIALKLDLKDWSRDLPGYTDAFIDRLSASIASHHLLGYILCGSFGDYAQRVKQKLPDVLISKEISSNFALDEGLSTDDFKRFRARGGRVVEYGGTLSEDSILKLHRNGLQVERSWEASLDKTLLSQVDFIWANDYEQASHMLGRSHLVLARRSHGNMDTASRRRTILDDQEDHLVQECEKIFREAGTEVRAALPVARKAMAELFEGSHLIDAFGIVLGYAMTLAGAGNQTAVFLRSGIPLLCNAVKINNASDFPENPRYLLREMLPKLTGFIRYAHRIGQDTAQIFEISRSDFVDIYPWSYATEYYFEQMLRIASELVSVEKLPAALLEVAAERWNLSRIRDLTANWHGQIGERHEALRFLLQLGIKLSGGQIEEVSHREANVWVFCRDHSDALRDFHHDKERLGIDEAIRRWEHLPPGTRIKVLEELPMGDIDGYPTTKYHIEYRLPYDEFARAYEAKNGESLSERPRAPVKKCLVLDLDGVLWKGTLDENGIAGVSVDEFHQKLQRTVLELKNRGVLLAVCSKNDGDLTRRAIETVPGMVLKPADFSAVKANWGDKATNMAEIARELNIGTDGIVFIDDQGIERAFVRDRLPEIDVPEFPRSVEEQSPFLKRLSQTFPYESATAEDAMRTIYIQQEIERRSDESRASSIAEFQAGLGITMGIHINDLDLLPRMAQLTLRTNQFNLSDRRYSVEDIRRLIERAVMGAVRLYAFDLSDRFGDSGLVGLVIAIREISGQWRLDTFCLSCRAFGRGVEQAMLAYVTRDLRDRLESGNPMVLLADYTPTEQNAHQAGFYAAHGFLEGARQGSSQVWSYDLGSEIPSLPSWIAVKSPSIPSRSQCENKRNPVDTSA